MPYTECLIVSSSILYILLNLSIEISYHMLLSIFIVSVTLWLLNTYNVSFLGSLKHLKVLHNLIENVYI